MKSKDLNEKPGEKSVREMAVGADDLVSESTTGKTCVTAYKQHISPLAAAAIAVALKIYFSTACSFCSASVLSR